MMSINIKKCVLMLGLSVALSATTSIAAQEGNNSEAAKEQLLSEAMSILDKVEASTPAAYSDVMKVREKLNQYRDFQVTDDSDDDSPELMFSRCGATTTEYSRQNKSRRVAFYDSCRGLKDESLFSKLRSEISTHKSVDYGKARELIMQKIDNHHGNVECCYTGKVIKVKEGSMPGSTNMNIEHTWPQSMGAKGVAKSDLHHLFPTDSKANSYRGSLPFGIVTDPNPKFSVGGSKTDGEVFEVRPQHRGNVARAMFYFSVRYNKGIDPKEEAVLRQWHKEDPVDPNERARNDAIEAIQHNRNPFIDHPEYVDQISNF